MRVLPPWVLFVPVFGASVFADLAPSTLRLKSNVELMLNERKTELASDISHFGLVFQPTQEMLRGSLQQVEAREHRGGFVLTRSQYFNPENFPARESHGGTFLYQLLRFWQPENRKADLQDRYVFANGPYRLEDIYTAHRKQVFLPPKQAGAPSPYPAMVLPFASADGKTIVEAADSYQVLLLIIENTPGEDLGKPWVNLINQTLSVDLLIEQVRRAYLEDRQRGTLSGDHTSYHVMEIVVTHAQKSLTGSNLQQVTKRFLDVELSETDLLENETVRHGLLSHYIQSLGYLLSYERLELTREEKVQIKRWLEKLEDYFPGKLDQLKDVHELAHVLHGLRLVQEHEHKLQ